VPAGGDLHCLGEPRAAPSTRVVSPDARRRGVSSGDRDGQGRQGNRGAKTSAAIKFSGDWMIDVFEGRLGGYKTYSAVERMMEWMSAGGVCFSNIHLKWDNFFRKAAKKYEVELDPLQHEFLDDAKIKEFHKFTAPFSMIVLDELHLWFNARDWSNASREVLAFLTQSRKATNDLILISQTINNIDKQYRHLVQHVYKYRDMQHYVIPVLGCGWPLNQYKVSIFDYTGVFQKSYYKFKDPEIYECYETNAIYQSPFQRLPRRLVKPRKIIVPMWKRVLPYAPLAVGGGIAAGTIL